MKKIFIASLVVISVFASSIVSALAIDKALTVYEIIKWGLTPHEVNSGEDEWVAMRDQTYALWQPYSSISSMARAFLSYDALSNLVSDLNGSGFPCYLEFNRNLQLYVVRGSGPVTGLTGVSVLDRYLTNGQRGLLCCEYNTDSLLSTISSTLTSLYNSLQSWFGGQLTGIYYWTNSINLSASRIDSALTSFLGNNTVSDIISAIPAASDLSNIESTLSSINDKLDNLSSSSGSAYDDSALLAALQPIISFYQDGVETVVLDSSSGTLFGNIQFERGTFSLLSLNASADADIFFLAENVYYSPSSLSFASPVRSSSSPTLSALGPTLTADADHITVTVKKTLDLPISVGTYDIQFFDTSGDAIALKTGDCFLPGSDVGVWQIRRAEGGYITIGSTTGLPEGFEFSDLFHSCVRFKVSDINSAPAQFSYWLDYFYNTDTYYSRFRIVSPDDATITFRYSTLHPVLAWLAQRQNSFQTWLGNGLNDLPGSSPSDLSNIESALSTIIDKMDNLPASVDNIVVNITEDNSAYNIFYVEDENGDKKSVTSVAGDSLSASGKLLQFLYKLIIGSAISDVDNSIGGLNDFFFDNAPSGLGEGVTVWD